MTSIINFRIFRYYFVILLFGLSVPSFAQEHQPTIESPLEEPGNAIFATIQEVVGELESNPDTDWTKVDLEGLRQHLIDMKAFTEEVDVLKNEAIENGTKITVKPKSKRAEKALERVFRMHPKMMKKEKGWEMNAKKIKDHWVVTCTTPREVEVEKIRALGYIGLLAEGAHHQLHHWMMATQKHGHH